MTLFHLPAREAFIHVQTYLSEFVFLLDVARLGYLLYHITIQIFGHFLSSRFIKLLHLEPLTGKWAMVKRFGPSHLDHALIYT